MTKENYINEMLHAVEECRGNTCYDDYQIKLMKDNGTKLVNYLYDLKGTTYVLKEEGEEPKEVVIEFDKFKFGHNDFQIYCDDYLVKKCMKQIFTKMKDEEKIGSYGSNGWGTAFVISYDPWQELK